MANKFYYSNLAVQTALSGSVSAGATAMNVGDATGFPTSFPYVLSVDMGADAEELVKVTNASGTNLTVERGFGGTSAQSHSVGAVVAHVYNAQDATDFRTHEQSSSNVHGLTGDLVSTGDAQTLANKTLTAPVVNDGTLAGTFTGAPTLSGDMAFSGAPTFTGNVTFTGGPDFTTTTTSFKAQTTDEPMVGAKLDADAGHRLMVYGNGDMKWSNGTDAYDVTLGRYVDPTDPTFIGLSTTAPVISVATATDHDVLDTRVDGEAGYRFGLEADGRMLWGDGTSSTLDTVLQRTGTRILTTNARFDADVETSSTFTTASGFTLVGVDLRKTCGICTVDVRVSVTQTLPADPKGNITDKTMGTIPTGFRPSITELYTTWSNSIAAGSASVGSDGVITLRTSTANGDIEAGTTVHVSATFVI